MAVFQTIETKRLRIKPTNIDDSQLILDIFNSPKWLKFIGERHVHTLLEAKRYIQEKMLPQLESLGYGNNTIIRKEDGVKIGTCGLYDRDGVDGVDIGFAFLPQYEGKGYAFESAQKIVTIAKRKYHLSKINGITTKENLSSQKLLKKLGLEFVKEITIPNDKEKLLLYTLEF